MATNIVNVGFKGTYPSSTADRTGYVSNGDNNDIFYFLGSNYGTAAWSNPEGGAHLTITHTNLQPGYDQVAKATNNVLATNSSATANLSPPNTNTGTVTFQFLTCKVKPSRCDIHGAFNNGGSSYRFDNLRIQGSNNGSNWEGIHNDGTYTPGSNGQFWINMYDDTNDPPATKYYEYIRVQWTTVNGAGFTGISEFKLYGDLFRTDGNEASQVSPITVVENLPKWTPEAGGVQDGDILYYRSGIVTNIRNTFYETSRLVMTGTLALSDNHFPNFYILDPNGSVRTVTLPPTPLEYQFFRLKTLDPNFAITVDDGGTVTTLDTSTLVADLYWDGTEWTSINYG